MDVIGCMITVKKSILNKVFRINEWLLAKLLFNLAIGLFLLLVADSGSRAMFKPVMLIILYITSVGAFGYFINDLFDRKTNFKSGQDCKKAKLPLSARILIPAALLAAASFPFVFLLENPRNYLVFLFIHVILLFTYSVPGMKIKNNVLGLFWDALYSYAMPALICSEIVRQCYVIKDLTMAQTIFPLVWLLLLGLRSIINHQLKDLSVDTLSGIKTFVIAIGSKAAYKMSLIITALEIIIFAIIVVAVFDVLWKIAALALLFFTIIEAIFLHTSLKKMFHDGKFWAVLNHFYDYYLFMGVMFLMAWQFNPLYLLVPVFYFLYRLSFFKWFYHHVILWIYYKTLGLMDRFRRYTTGK